MLKDYISEKTAKTLIFILSCTMLIAFLLFAVNAHASQKTTVGINPAANMEFQQKQLAEMMALNQQMEQLETQLGELQKQNSDFEQQNAELAQQQAEIETTREELLASFGMEYVGDFHLTSYCAEAYPHICGGNGVTASGTVPTPGITCAADWSVFPPGTWLYIDGIGMRRVEDSGGAIKGNRLDIVVDTHANALRWGGQGNHGVWVMKG